MQESGGTLLAYAGWCHATFRGFWFSAAMTSVREIKSMDEYQSALGSAGDKLVMSL